MIGKEFNERRQHFRMTMDAKLTFHVRGKKSTYKGICKDLSQGGIKFETNKALTIGTTLDVTIDLGSPKFKPMKAELEIIRIEKAENNNYAASGKVLGLE